MPAEPAPASLPVAAARRRRLRADRARQLADLLRHQILAGGFPGGVLPLEHTLAADYRASRNTVRQALEMLRDEQLVDRQPGVGTVVVCEKRPHGLNRLQGLAETLNEHGRVTNEVRTVGPLRAPGPVATGSACPDTATCSASSGCAASLAGALGLWQLLTSLDVDLWLRCE